jgi:Folate-dependent phosphoribosylglycinamide formyltransferase PurN
MVIGIIGENCSGKSTLANVISSAVGAEIVSGRDYLRMAKSEEEAKVQFRKKLEKAVSGQSIIYVISEPEYLSMLPQGAVRILVGADLETIKERFKSRMHGHLPEPVARMLEKKHGIFDGGSYDFYYDGVNGDPAPLCELLKQAEKETGTSWKPKD